MIIFQHLVKIILISLPIHNVFHFKNIPHRQQNIGKAFINEHVLLFVLIHPIMVTLLES